MLSKKHNFTFFTIAGLFTLVTVLSVRFYISKPDVAVSVESNVAMKPPIGKLAEVVTPQTDNKQLLSETREDITIEMTSAKVIGTGMEIGICYTTPDNAEWYPMPGHLFYGNYEIYPDEIEFLAGERFADGKSMGRRCALIRYRINDVSTLVTPVELSILQLYAPGREMYTPCEEFRERMATNPKVKAYDLKVECVETSDGSISATLLEHDPSISSEEANRILNEIASAEINGPWIFRIDEIER